MTPITYRQISTGREIERVEPWPAADRDEDFERVEPNDGPDVHPDAREAAETLGVDIEEVEGDDEEVTLEDVLDHARELGIDPDAPGGSEPDEAPPASENARRLAEENGLDLADVSPNSAGQITVAEVREHLRFARTGETPENDEEE